jgi:hypothetical protein
MLVHTYQRNQGSRKTYSTMSGQAKTSTAKRVSRTILTADTRDTVNGLRYVEKEVAEACNVGTDASED